MSISLLSGIFASLKVSILEKINRLIPIINKIVAIVQARLGSTRLPGKVLKEINGKSLIEILLHRLSHSKKINKIILATSNNLENNKLEEVVKNAGYDVFRGSEVDVLSRYYQAAKPYKPEIILTVSCKISILFSAIEYASIPL